MNILYISNAMDDKTLNSIIINAKSAPSLASNKYHTLVVNGLKKNKNVNVSHICVPPISRKTSDKLFVSLRTCKDGKITYKYIPVINIPIVRNIGVFMYLLFYLIFHVKNYDAVVYDVLMTTTAICLSCLKLLSSVPLIGIVTDIPGKRAKASRGIKKIYDKISFDLLNCSNGYVFLTEYMNELINKKNKKYIVSEGLVDINMKYCKNEKENKYEKKICIYAGSIKKIYGIKTLTEAFIKANVPNSELHIYGDGDYKNNLIEICKKNNNIKYLGVKPNEFIVEEEIKASLLINPRPTNPEYTKYSFPSKNMEYMVSGTPLLTTKLPGMPKEYYSYVYLIEDESVDGLSDILKKILLKPQNELYDLGDKAKHWVISEKNNVLQAKKIIDLIGDLI